MMFHDKAATVQRRKRSISLRWGMCPVCSVHVTADPFSLPLFEAVIYRRSHRSITFRHNKCGAQWTMTLANLHKVALAQRIAHPKINAEAWPGWVATWTKDAAKNERRGRPRKGRRRGKSSRGRRAATVLSNPPTKLS
jgi:hypothetical protein